MTTGPLTEEPLRLLLIGDVGSTGHYHVGDDAMLVGLLSAADRAGISVSHIVVTAEPAASIARFGGGAIGLAGFARCSDQDDRLRLLERLDDRPDPVTVEAITGADAVVITGGGNLNRSWPELVYERLALSRLARRLDTPVVLTGQSLGPVLGPEVLPLVRELLTTARVVGVRERSSYGLAGQLGVEPGRLVLGYDDAAGLAAEPPADAESVMFGGPFVAVTINALDEDSLLDLGDQLTELARRLGVRLLFVPHTGAADPESEPVEDVAVARRLAELTGGRAVGLPTATEAVWYCQQASMVISSRYHPVVFALAHAVPPLFLPQDGYTAMKGAGALDLLGLADCQVPVAVARLTLAEAATAVWHRRAEIGRHLHQNAPEHGWDAHLRWLVRSLAGRAVLPSPPVPPAPTALRIFQARQESPPTTFVDVLESELAEALDRLTAAAGELAALHRRAETAERYAASLETGSVQARDYALSLERRAEVAEEYAASLAGRVESAEQYAATLQDALAQRQGLDQGGAEH